MHLLDRVLPDYHYDETHMISINASPAKVYEAIQQIKPQEIAFLRLLFYIRGFPVSLFRKKARLFPESEPIITLALRNGFTSMGDDPEQEIVLGLIGQPWKLSGGKIIRKYRSFREVDTADYAFMAMNFHLRPGSRGDTVTLSTTTRVYIPDPSNRKKFALYWLFIKPGSALIRLMMLRAVKKRAEDDFTPS